MKGTTGEGLFDILGLEERADAPEAKPLVKPDMDAGEAAKAILVRLAVPAVIGAIGAMGAMADTGLDLAEILPVIATCALLVVAWWIAHWFFARWRKANKGNPRADAIVIGCRAVLWSLFALVFCIVAAVIPRRMYGGQTSREAWTLGIGWKWFCIGAFARRPPVRATRQRRQPPGAQRACAPAAQRRAPVGASCSEWGARPLSPSWRRWALPSAQRMPGRLCTRSPRQGRSAPMP